MGDCYPWRVLVHNDMLHIQYPESAQFLLRSHPHGVYTTTCTIGGGSRLVLWDRHMKRLRQSLMEFSLAHSSHSDTGIIQHLVDTKICPSLGSALQASMTFKRDAEEMIICVLVCPGAQPEALDLYIHISNYTPAYNVAHLAIMGPSRSLPIAKQSSWVCSRQVLEQMKPAHATEVVLSNTGEALLEGLTTNLFVISNRDGTSEKNASSELGDLSIQTASLKDGVLPGVIRDLILEICKKKGIHLIEEAPLWKTRKIWREAFLTNSVKLMQPVASIQMPTPWNVGFVPAYWSNSEWENLNLQVDGKITKMIKEEILKQIHNEAIAVNTFLQCI